MAPHLSFSGAVVALAPEDTTRRGRSRTRRAVSTPPASAAPQAPLVVRPQERRLSTLGEASEPGQVRDILNRGSVAELDGLPGIGPVRAERIVAFRDSAGGFRSADDLARVPGISLAFAHRLWTAGGAR
jgi:competence protein ComEA